MTGETLQWYILADRLKKTVGYVKSHTSSTQFLEWQAYIEQDLNAFHREDYFWASIAAEVARVLAKDPKRIDIKDYLVKFTVDKVAEQQAAMTEDEKREQMILWSKLAWGGMVGLDPGALVTEDLQDGVT